MTEVRYPHLKRWLEQQRLHIGWLPSEKEDEQAGAFFAYQGEVVQAWKVERHYPRFWTPYTEPVERMQYIIQFADGQLMSWIMDDVLMPCGLCAECSGPTIDDYLCGSCRAVSTDAGGD